MLRVLLGSWRKLTRVYLSSLPFGPLLLLQLRYTLPLHNLPPASPLVSRLADLPLPLPTSTRLTPHTTPTHTSIANPPPPPVGRLPSLLMSLQPHPLSHLA
jgi:hypothetical protein